LKRSFTFGPKRLPTCGDGAGVVDDDRSAGNLAFRARDLCCGWRVFTSNAADRGMFTVNKEKAMALAVALALLGAGVWLSSSSPVATSSSAGGTTGDGKTEKVAFPREEKERERVRQRRQASLTPLGTQRAAAVERGNASLQKALAAPGKGNLFVDVKGIAQSPLLQQLLACRKDQAQAPLDDIREKFGVDPTKDVHRMGVSEGVLAATGAFRDLKLPPDVGAPSPYGDTAQVYPSKSDQHLAKVGDGLLLVADSEEALHAAIDRVEGRAEAEAPSWSAEMNEADVVGNLSAAALQSMFKGGAGDRFDQVKDMLQDGVVRVNVDDAVGASFDLTATSQEDAAELVKTLKGAVASMRTQAAVEENSKLVALLKQARVEDFADGTFAVDIAVPGPFLLDLMGCKANPPQAN